MRSSTRWWSGTGPPPPLVEGRRAEDEGVRGVTEEPAARAATESPAAPTRSRLWTAIIVTLVVVGLLITVSPAIYSARLGVDWHGVQVLLVAVIVAAILARK